MAITINGRPKQLTLNSSPLIKASLMPVYNDIVYTVTSTNVGQCKFRYIADIYINGIFIKRLKLFPNTIGKADFKINRVLEDYVANTITSNITGVTQDTGKILGYVIKFGEEYDTSADCSSVPTIYTDLTLTDTDYAWNGALQYKSWLDYISTAEQFIMGTGYTGQFLTEQPSNILVPMGSQSELSFLQLPYLSDVAKIRINTYNHSGALIDTNDITNTYSTVSTINDMFITIGVGPENINNEFNSSIINSAVKYYEVYLINGSNATISEIKRYEIDRRQTKYESFRFKWINKLGGTDSYTFNMTRIITTDIQRTEYNKLLGSYNASAATWNYSLGDRGKTNIAIDANDKINVNSNWLTVQESVWMRDLFESINVMIQEVNTIYPFFQMRPEDEGLPDINPIVSIACTTDIDLTEVLFDLCDTTLNGDLLDNSRNVLDITNNEVTIGAALGGDILSQCGSIYQYNKTLNLFPIVITSTSYNDKTRGSIKNINQQIEFKYAYDKNTQRN